MARSRGVTLVELLVAIVLLAIVGQTLLRLLTTAQRLFRAQSERAALQATVRAGAAFVSAELRPLDPADLLGIAADRVVYRAPRSTAVACRATRDTIMLRRQPAWGYRSISATRDSLLLFVDGSPAGAEERWAVLPVTGPAGSGTCPDGVPALAVPTAVPSATLIGVVLDAPVLTFEVMEVRLYQSGGQYWLGSRSISGGETQVQPALGPLAVNGLGLEPLTADGSPALTPSAVRMVDMLLRGVTDGAVAEGVGSPGVLLDSLTGAAEFRNAR